ncbi:hypothetical protein BGZ50_007576 [Haplosporangium sp. Z 11]|nr:hypothetical protein BGZ50_007576 [Haplosporangium sp. Z 11]
MCILLWTLPNSNHPRFKFAFASNRDEILTRKTSQADFWDLDTVLKKATRRGDDLLSTQPQSSTPSRVGVISGVDLQPSNAVNYIIQERETTASGEEKVTLTLSTKEVPGTWLGMTTHGDLVALTNYRETPDYVVEAHPPKLSRGKVCGEYLVSMAEAHEDAEKKASDHGATTDIADDRAEQWFKRRAAGWETEFEGLNLLVVQNAGEQQCVGGNREGSEMMTFKADKKDSVVVESAQPASSEVASTTFTLEITPGSVVGVSNSVFSRPWNKVKIGTQALAKTLNESIEVFGTGMHASLRTPTEGSLITIDMSSQPVTPMPALEDQLLTDDIKEVAWLVTEMLTLMRIHTKPFTEDSQDSNDSGAGLRERVFIPYVKWGVPPYEYGTRSSTIVLFGRQSRLGVYVEKTWYGPVDEATGRNILYEPNTAEGVVWWQGLVGQPRQEWKQIQGEELEQLFQIANDIRASVGVTA